MTAPLTWYNGRYTAQARLGAGGMGITYLAREKDARRQVVIKTIQPMHLSSAIAHQRFRREVRALGAAKHRHTIELYHSSFDPPPFMVLEYLPNGHLGTKIADKLCPTRS